MEGSVSKNKIFVYLLLSFAIDGCSSDSSPSPSGVPPSLVNICRTHASQPWSRKMKMHYQRILSFQMERLGQGCQVLRVDLTTASGGDRKKLSRHFQELLRRVKRELGYKVYALNVFTSEGNGVIHGIWAIKAEKAVWIDQAWLSSEWERIHAAKIVYIKRLGSRRGAVSGGDCKRVAGYLVSQYLAGQPCVLRLSWPWKSLSLSLGKSWSALRSEMKKGLPVSTWVGESNFNRDLTFKDIINTWQEILLKGHSLIAGAVFFRSGREIDHAYL